MKVKWYHIVLGIAALAILFYFLKPKQQEQKKDGGGSGGGGGGGGGWGYIKILQNQLPYIQIKQTKIEVF